MDVTDSGKKPLPIMFCSAPKRESAWGPGWKIGSGGGSLLPAGDWDARGEEQQKDRRVEWTRGIGAANAPADRRSPPQQLPEPTAKARHGCSSACRGERGQEEAQSVNVQRCKRQGATRTRLRPPCGSFARAGHCQAAAGRFRSLMRRS